MLAQLIKIIYRSANYSILNSTFHPSYLCNISRCFILSVNIFPLIFNKMVISLHLYLDSTHTNCPVTIHKIFNYILYGYWGASLVSLAHVARSARGPRGHLFNLRSNQGLSPFQNLFLSSPGTRCPVHSMSRFNECLNLACTLVYVVCVVRILE
jgi:hypothetical protein